MKPIKYCRYILYKLFIHMAVMLGGKNNSYIENSLLRARDVIESAEKKEVLEAALRSKIASDLKGADIAVNTNTVDGLRDYLNTLKSATDRQTAFIAILSALAQLSSARMAAARLLLMSEIRMSSGRISAVDNTSLISARHDGRWVLCRKDRITLDEGNLLIREFANLMDQSGWVCAHDSEKLYSDFINSCLVPALANAKEASIGTQEACVALRVGVFTQDPKNKQTSPMIDVSVTLRTGPIPSTASLIIRFQRAETALN